VNRYPSMLFSFLFPLGKRGVSPRGRGEELLLSVNSPTFTPPTGILILTLTDLRIQEHDSL
jgi:hypothetical protein